MNINYRRTLIESFNALFCLFFLNISLLLDMLYKLLDDFSFSANVSFVSLILSDDSLESSSPFSVLHNSEKIECNL